MIAQGPIHFLLVDDLEENLLALEALLQREGLVCLKARSGEEALELLLVHDVALALLDVQMPEMDGFQLAEFMRGSDRTRHVPIIFLTAGSADRQRRFRGYEAGAVDFLQKPIEADILRSKAAVFFDMFEQRRRIVAQRDELDRLTGALKEADANKNRFLAVLGHELRNPATALGAGLNLLEKREGTGDAREIRVQMRRSVDHLSRLVDDLLDIARIDQGKISLRLGTILLAELVDFSVSAASPAIEARRHRLTVDLPHDPVELTGDHARLAQVLINLLNNAARYTDSPGTIALSARQEGDAVTIEVSDSGVGIPADQQDAIFTLFAQGPAASGNSRDGLGIGLALVRQLVELHGGTIELAASAPGKGSTFRVTLPLSGPD
ncbi:phospho-acceptor domain-containing protein [Novosphingobium kunmingense]|uniref:histidine kinase n=1 Tax=Novosphingobium kunmingense TaxID=1211806 RepID=A0A2N0H3B8_9SPHN|nr:hybrid sensor histidine kinase/response regulator [Novosphingobium kunmingense]PKB13435.1 phospho-acceptor domain-containing protein [Novosphingobium kunmingense]